jgi:hypothetical protein
MQAAHDLGNVGGRWDLWNPWYYWLFRAPDPGVWTSVEWIQGDEDEPWDGSPNISPVTELLELERNGWLIVGFWWRPLYSAILRSRLSMDVSR